MQHILLVVLVAAVASASSPDGARWESSHGLVFIFSAATGTWIGQKPVTKAQFRRFSADHRGAGPATARGISGDRAAAYADWLSRFEIAQGTLGPDAHFRLPNAQEQAANAADEALGFRMVLVTENEARASHPFIPAIAIGAGALGLGLLVMSVMGRQRRKDQQEIAELAHMHPAAAHASEAGYDLVIAPEAVKPTNPMVLANSPAELDTRNSSIVTSILDVRTRAAKARMAPATPAPPKLPKLKPAKSKPKTHEPLNEETWDRLVAATAAVPPIRLPAGAKPEVVEDETRDDFELPRHTKVKRTKSAVNSILALDDSTLNTLLKADESFDIDDFVDGID